MHNEYKNILSLSASEVRQYFLKQENYCSINIPPYFQFETLLQRLDTYLKEKTVSCCYDLNNISHGESVNNIIYHSKDGLYQWRPVQIIHPVLYIELLNIICSESNWKTILQRFKLFQSNPRITCSSIPVIRKAKQTNTSATVLNWWDKIEQSILAESLQFSYIFTTDITDFYPSIYTHSISWALHNKSVSQLNRFSRNSEQLLGDKIDAVITKMQHRQTNGIPQGSSIMNFIAEIVLGYADLLLSEKLKNRILDYRIFRYRDDYKILVNNPRDGEKILKFLTEILLDMGLKLNTSKTTSSEDVIASCIKSDKLAWISQSNFMALLNPSYRCRIANEEWKFANQQKTLLGIYQFSKQYPNSGTVDRLLSIFHSKLGLTQHDRCDNVKVLISILTNIMSTNPRSYPQTSALLSCFLRRVKKSEKLTILNNIKKKLAQKPHTDFLDIWLQRISWQLNSTEEYSPKLCKIVQNPNEILWNCDWVTDKKVKEIFETSTIIDQNILANMPEYIEEKEVNMFLEYPY